MFQVSYTEIKGNLGCMFRDEKYRHIFDGKIVGRKRDGLIDIREQINLRIDKKSSKLFKRQELSGLLLVARKSPATPLRMDTQK